jgi:hypothetical protein
MQFPATIQGLALQILVDPHGWPEAKIVRALLGNYEAAARQAGAARSIDADTAVS